MSHELLWSLPLTTEKVWGSTTFDHGESVYATEIRVPLLIVPPSGDRSEAVVVHENVSLHNLPATVVDLIGLSAGSPFPGHSLAKLWRGAAGEFRPAASEFVLQSLRHPIPSIPTRADRQQAAAR